jgi:O-antigen ligase
MMLDFVFWVALGLFIVTISLLTLNPIFGIPLLFISKPVIDATFERPVLFDLRLTELTGVLVPVLVCLHMVLGKREASFGRMPHKYLWLLYVANVFFFSSLIAYQQDLRSGANVFFRHVNGFVGFFMVQAFFLPPARRVWLFRSLIVAGLFPVGVGVFQMVTGATWRVQQTEGVIRNIGLWHDAVNIRQYMLQTLLVLLLYSAVYAGPRVWKQLGLIAYMAATVMVMIKAFSKAGFATLALWSGCWGLLFRKYAVLWIPTITIVLLGGLWAADVIGNVLQMFHKEIGFFQGEVSGTRTFAGRWYAWQEMMEEWQGYEWFSKVFGSGRVATGAHNDYLQLLFHGGFVGLLCYVGLLGTLGVKVFLNLRQDLTPMNLIACMAFLMWMVDTIGLVPSAYPGYQWFVWGMVGLSLRLHAENRLEAAPNPVIALSEESSRSVLAPEGLPLQPARKYPLLSP